MGTLTKNHWNRKTNAMSCWLSSYWRAQMQELLQGVDSPLGLATAFALGTLTSFFPIPIVDSLLAIGLAARFGRLNKSAIIVARLVWNDLLVMPLYAPGFKLGQWVMVNILGAEAPALPANAHLLWLLSFVTGVVILAGFAAFSGFMVVFLCAKMAQSRKLAVI